MKEQEDRIMHVIKQQQDFNKLLNDIVKKKISETDKTIFVSGRRFDFTIDDGKAIAVFESHQWVAVEISLKGNPFIRVYPETIVGKEVTYRLNEKEGISHVVSNDILSYFVKPI